MFMVKKTHILNMAILPNWSLQAIQSKSQQAFCGNQPIYSKYIYGKAKSKIVKTILKISKVQQIKLPEIKTIKLQSSQQVVLDQGPKVQNKELKLECHLAGDKGPAATQWEEGLFIKWQWPCEHLKGRK